MVLFSKRCGWMASRVSEEAHGHAIGFRFNLRAINKRPGKGLAWGKEKEHPRKK